MNNSASILKDPNLPAVALLTIAVNKYGLTCFDWEPFILRKELEEDLGITLTDLQSDKLQAAITIFTTDSFESDWHTFNVCVHLLNNEHASFDTLDPIDAESIAAILPELEVLRNDDEGLTFSDEVNAYAGLIFYEYGCSKAPDIFPTAIMPAAVEADMTEKNEALSELYKAKKLHLEQLLKQIEQFYIAN